MNGIPTRYLELGVEMPDDCPECDGGEYLGNRNLVEYLVMCPHFSSLKILFCIRSVKQ